MKKIVFFSLIVLSSCYSEKKKEKIFRFFDPFTFTFKDPISDSIKSNPHFEVIYSNDTILGYHFVYWDINNLLESVKCKRDIVEKYSFSSKGRKNINVDSTFEELIPVITTVIDSNVCIRRYNYYYNQPNSSQTVAIKYFYGSYQKTFVIKEGKLNIRMEEALEKEEMALDTSIVAYLKTDIFSRKKDSLIVTTILDFFNSKHQVRNSYPSSLYDPFTIFLINPKTKYEIME